jgi:uncharacterized membrane protein HdeD (DUF308 family)
MHLERNLNPTLSRLYIATGVFMIVLALLLFRLLTLPLAVMVIVCGVLSIASGYLHH